MQNPEISFDINLPNVDQEVRDAFFSIVDKQNEQEMIKQTFSLLVMNSFVSARPDEPTNSLGAGVGASSFEIISNQITNWLSQISRDFDIGVNYRPGDQMTTQQLQVALSTQLLTTVLLSTEILVLEVISKIPVEQVQEQPPQLRQVTLWVMST